MKSFWRFAMVAATAAMFAACDSDSGTSASDSNAASQESSSSSVDPESPQGDDTKSDKSSSSSSGVILSSSSAEKVDPESTQGDNSSSSIDAKGDVSSSSTNLVVYSSSGDVIIEIGSSSSATANNSSNSCIVDGSITVMYNFVYECIGGEWTLVVYDAINGQLTYDTLVDPRDNQRYLTIEVSGYDTTNTDNVITFTVMAQNLNYGTMTLGANEQDDDNTVEKYCYSDTAWYCEQFGGLYQWAEMMNLPYDCNTQSCADQIDPDGDGFHQGICPDGWHLITYNEMFALASNWNNSANGGYAGMKAMVLWSNAQGTNNSGFSAVGAGLHANGKYMYLFEEARFFYPAEYNDAQAYGGMLADVSTSSNDHNKPKKIWGFSARCVKNY